MPGQPKGPRPSALGEGMSLAYYFPLAVLLGGLAGRWIGGRFHHPSLGTAIGVLWGIISGCYEVFKVSRRISKGGNE